MGSITNRTHLTPEEVTEFIDLGVDFGETTIMWAIDEDNYAFLFPRVSHICRWKSWRMLPCPNLQEVLEVLPKYVEDDNLEWTWAIAIQPENGFYTAFYVRPGDDIWLNKSDQQSEYIIEVAIGLLRWVCQNHPETLTKTEYNGDKRDV